jgi:hypothetical protein
LWLHDSSRVFALIRTLTFASAKSFFVREQFVNLSSEAHSKRIREHHEGENTTYCIYVNRLFWIIFRSGQAFAMPNQFSLINEKIE